MENLFVAVGRYNVAGDSKTIKYSKDGINWEYTKQTGFTNKGLGVAYNPSKNLWVATGGDNNKLKTIKHSNDGMVWEDNKSGGFDHSPVSLSLGGVACNPSKNTWVAVGNAGVSVSTIQHSSDGIDWESITSGGFTDLGTAVAYNPDKNTWVAVGNAGVSVSTIQHSSDGLVWEDSISGGFTDPGSGERAGLGIAYNQSNNTWVAVGTSNEPFKTIQHSSDGIKWEDSKSGGFSGQGTGVTYSLAKNMWVAVGNAGVSVSTIQHSYDGIHWNDSESGGFYPSLSIYGGVTYSPVSNLWVAVSGNSSVAGVDFNDVQYSSDGINWKYGGGGNAFISLGIASTPGLIVPGKTLL